MFRSSAHCSMLQTLSVECGCNPLKTKQEDDKVLIERSASVPSLSSGDFSTQPGYRGGNGGRNREPPDRTQR